MDTDPTAPISTPQPVVLSEEEDRVFRESDLPDLIGGAANFARRYDAPFLTVVEFIGADGKPDYIPITHPKYSGQVADSRERSEALVRAVERVIARDHTPPESDAARQRKAKSKIVRK